MKTTKVVAALIKNDKNEYLIFKRPKNKARGGLWEFAGGKVEEGESLNEALIRELKEELDIIIEPGKIFMQVQHQYPDILIELSVIDSSIKSGKLKLKEHQDFKWVNPENFDKYEFCPADSEILEKIKIRSQ